ncbi:FAD-binding protein [Bordetella petrii]|nr:FAD-binding protein [Bordetella petrii]
MTAFDTEVDVLVIGAGGAGLAAAVAAHEGGASVAVVEKLDRPGGNTMLSTGSVPGAGSRFQRAVGIVDDPQTMVDDLMSLSGPHDADALTRQLAECSAELVEWMADVMQVKLDIIQDYKHVAHSVPRLHAPASRKGQDLVDDMVAAVDRRGIPLVLSNPTVNLELDADGAVIGAQTLSASGERATIGARKTILCVNGFGANAELVAKYCPQISGATYVGARGSQGEAVGWGERLGALLGNMESYQGYATIIEPHGELLSWTTIEKGGILVNERGERFGDEALGYSGYTEAVLRQAGPVYAIFDQRIRDIANREPWFKEVLDYGGAKMATDVATLASSIGVDAGVLARTLDSYADAAVGKHADSHSRNDFGIAPLQPPYWYTRVGPALLSTQGGLQIDEQARVLDQNRRPIPNLYAAGGAVAGISGKQGGKGYASGSGLLHAIGLGWIAGRASARALQHGG